MRRKRINLTESQLFGLIRRAINEAYSIEGNEFDGLSRKFVSDIKGSYKNCSWETLAKEVAESVCNLALRGGKRNAIRYGNDYTYANEAAIEVRFDDVDCPFDVYAKFTYLMDGNLPYDIHILEIDAYPDPDIDETSEEEEDFHDAVRDYILGNLSVDAVERAVQIFLAKVERRRKMTNPNESIARRINENVNGYEDWECVLDYIETDGRLRTTIDWVIQACVKKARRGVVLDREHLVNCYTLRRLCQIGVKEMSKYYEQRLYLSNEDKRRVREDLADLILSYVDYEMGEQNESVAHRVTERVMRKPREETEQDLVDACIDHICRWFGVDIDPDGTLYEELEDYLYTCDMRGGVVDYSPSAVWNILKSNGCT